jgi:hypothetical protein
MLDPTSSPRERKELNSSRSVYFHADLVSPSSDDIVNTAYNKPNADRDNRDNDSDHGKNNPSLLSSFLVYILILLILIENLTSAILPSHPTVDLDFDVNKARNNLIELTSIGSKIIGSDENEIIAPNILLWQLHDIKRAAHPDYINIEIELQHVSGQFYESFLGGINNVYSELTNVVVRVSWPQALPKTGQSDVSKQRALLINAHFDSAPGSPGAADDTLGCVCMIEVLRHLVSLSHSMIPSTSYRNPVILLFNGGEEAHQPAAHGFITQHRWASEVKYLINLEAVGSGGKEMIFQSNSGWLMEQYGASVPYPHATVIGSELFRHILKQVSATDWGTFLQYGPQDILGVDSAYVENGYVYHTSFDSHKVIPGSCPRQLTSAHVLTILLVNAQMEQLSIRTRICWHSRRNFATRTRLHVPPATALPIRMERSWRCFMTF